VEFVPHAAVGSDLFVADRSSSLSPYVRAKSAMTRINLPLHRLVSHCLLMEMLTLPAVRAVVRVRFIQTRAGLAGPACHAVAVFMVAHELCFDFCQHFLSPSQKDGQFPRLHHGRRFHSGRHSC
jgi:hypothetical protein